MHAACDKPHRRLTEWFGSPNLECRALVTKVARPTRAMLPVDTGTSTHDDDLGERRAGVNVETTVICDRTALARERADWDRLVASVPNPVVYNTYAYAMTSWEHFDAHHSEPRVICVRADGDLIGMAPLRLRRRWNGAVHETVLEFLGNVTSDRHGIVALPGHEAAVADAVITATLRMKWDQWLLTEVVADTPMRTALDARLRAHGLEIEVFEQSQAMVTDLPPSWEDFRASHKQMRKNLSALERKVPDLRFERFLDPTSVGVGLDHYEAVADLTWKKGEVGILKNDASRSFYRRLLPQLATDGVSGLRVLWAGEELMAAQMTFVIGDVAYFHMDDYNPAFKRLSPGMMIVAMAIRDLMEHSDIRRLDYLSGHAGYMAPWATGSVANESLRVRRPRTLANRAHRILRPAMALRGRISARGSGAGEAVPPTG